MLTKKQQRLRRSRQTRLRIAQSGTARLTVFRSNLHIFANVISDLLHHARSEEQIRQSLFGRIENLERARLYAPELAPPLRALLVELERLLGADEVSLGD